MRHVKECSEIAGLSAKTKTTDKCVLLKNNILKSSLSNESTLSKKNDTTKKSAVKVKCTRCNKSIIICKHCGQYVCEAKLIGFSLICLLCGKPQNGHSNKSLPGHVKSCKKFVCNYCGEPMAETKLKGISLVCPSCGRIQLG